MLALVCSARMNGANQSIDVLIVASSAPDMAGLRPYLGDKLDGQVRTLKVRGKAVGLGIGVAGSGTARGIVALEPIAVIHIGTCGVYPGLAQYHPNDVLIPDRAQVISMAVNAKRSVFPGPMITSVEYSPALVAGMAQLASRATVAQVATPMARTVDDSVAATVQPSTGCHGENLEAFAVVQAACAAQVACAGVFGISNVVGSTGEGDWQKFHRSSVVAAAEVVVSWMEQGAPGLRRR